MPVIRMSQSLFKNTGRLAEITTVTFCRFEHRVRGCTIFTAYHFL